MAQNLHPGKHPPNSYREQSMSSIPKVLHRKTGHAKPLYQLYQFGFNPTNGCWLNGGWITLPKKEWNERWKTHEKMYGGVAPMLKKQHYKNKGVAIKNMTPAQKQAWKFFSGTMHLNCLAGGFHHTIGVELAGNTLSLQSIQWMRKKGYKIIPLTQNRWEKQKGKKPVNQLKGLKGIPPDLIEDHKEPVDTVEMTLRQNEQRSKEVADAWATMATDPQFSGQDLLKCMAVHDLIETEEDIIREEWNISRGKPNPYEDIKRATARYVTRRAELKKLPFFDKAYEDSKKSHNESARINLDNSKGRLYSYFLPRFNDDGSHDPWGDKDVPWGQERGQ